LRAFSTRRRCGRTGITGRASKPKPFLEVDEVECDRFVDVIFKRKFFAAQATAKATSAVAA
jgi:hypothetical protein